jgi:hypothetical protein
MDDAHDELRSMLSAIDPVPSGRAVDPPSSPAARALLEATMQTNPEPRTDAAGPRDASRHRPLLVAAGVLLIVALGVGAVLLADDGSPTPEVAAPTSVPAEEVVALELAAFDPMAMCLALDPAVLGEAPVAFGGVVAAVADGAVTIEVDRWYVGGDAAVVTLAIPSGSSPALDGVDFVEGERYLVSGEDGQVRTCGLSGPESPELLAAFEEAFPG